MNNGLNNKFPTVIKRDFTGIDSEDNSERHILELRGSVNNSGLTDISEEHMGILFSAQQNQTTTHGNSAASIMVETTVDNTGVITGSDIVLNVKNNVSTAASTLNEGLRITKERGLTIASDLQVGGNAVVTGNLTVNGTTTTISTTNTVVQDSLIELNSGLTGTNSNDSGILIERGSTGDNAFMGWNETTDKFVVATTNTTATDTGSIENQTLANFGCNILTAGTLTLADGSITDSGGTISFGDENLSTTGTLASGILSVTGTGAFSSTISAATGSTVGNLTLGNGSITDSGGTISFGDENLSTTGTLASGNLSVTGTGAFSSTISAATGSTVGNLTLANGSITDSGGSISFGDENLSTSGTLGCGVLTAATGSTVGNLTLANGSITDSGGSISFGGNNIDGSGDLTMASITMTGFSVDADGDVITNSINNTSGGITDTGAIAGATTITASGAIQGGSLTDGTGTLTGGALSGITTMTASGVITGGGLSLTLTDSAQGDIYYRHSDGNFKRLAIGTDGQVLKANSGVPEWAAESGGGGGISFDGSTANGLLTFKDADEATVESNLTFDGSTLNISGNITGVTAVTASGAITGDSITDSTATLSSGALSGATSIDGTGDLTMGTITMTGFSVDSDGEVVTKSIDNTNGGITNTGAIAGASTISASSTVTVGTLTDGTATLSSGALSGVTTINASSTVNCGAITSTGNLEVTGTLTGDTSLTLDSITITTAELEVLDGVTPGTAAASKALVVSADRDIGTIRNLTIDGTFSDGNYTFDTSGNVTGLGTVGCGAITATSANLSGGNLSDVVTINGFSASNLTLASAATRSIVLDSAVDITLDAAGNDIFLHSNGNLYGSLTKDSGTNNLIIKSGSTTAATFTGANVSFAGTLGCGAITSTGNLAVTGTLTGDTSLTLDSITITTAELGVLDGVAAGTATASKALVVDGNKDIGTIRNLTIDGEFTDGNYTFDTSGNVSGLGTVGCGAITSSGNLAVTGTLTGDTSLTLDSTTITTAELGVLDSVTPGTATASKALVVDSNRDIDNIRNLELTSGGAINFGTSDITLAHNAGVGLTLTNTVSTDNKPIVLSLKSEEDEIISGEEIGRIDFTAGDSDGTDAISVAASIAAVAEDTFAADNNSTGLAFKLGVSGAATEMFRMDHDGDFKVLTDGSAIAFGADNEIELTHVHDTGLRLTDSGGTPTLQLHDAGESISSDGAKLILTSNGVAFSMPTADGSNGQQLTTDGSGTLSWAAAGSGGGGGGGISFDGSTANGLLTFKDSDEATVESNLTFDGSILDITGYVKQSKGFTTLTATTVGYTASSVEYLLCSFSVPSGALLTELTWLATKPAYLYVNSLWQTLNSVTGSLTLVGGTSQLGDQFKLGGSNGNVTIPANIDGYGNLVSNDFESINYWSRSDFTTGSSGSFIFSKMPFSYPPSTSVYNSSASNTTYYFTIAGSNNNSGSVSTSNISGGPTSRTLSNVNFADTDDIWSTSSAHLLSVGDLIEFTAAGSGATGYSTSTNYFVKENSVTATIGGNWTYTGGADKYWTTSTSNGLSNYDTITFTSSGGGAEYSGSAVFNTSTTYYVLNVGSYGGNTLQLASSLSNAQENNYIGYSDGSHTSSSSSWAAQTIDATKFTLSTSIGGSKVTGTGDASSDWTAKAYMHMIVANWTFDYTGGTVEDIWSTSVAHGLSVGVKIQFVKSGGGATGYSINTDYYVVSVPSSTTVQLSASSGGSVVAGSADSSGNWYAVNTDKNEFKMALTYLLM